MPPTHPKIGFTALLVLILAGCQIGNVSIQQQPTVKAPGEPQQTNVTATVLPAPTDTATPALPPTSTPTPTVPPTPTLALPVKIGDISPGNIAEITTRNFGALEEVMRWGNGAIRHIAWSPDGDFLAVVTSRSVQIFTAETLELIQSIDQDGTVNEFKFSPDGTLAAMLTCSHQWSEIRLWPWEGGKLVKGDYSLKIKGCVGNFEFSPDGLSVAAPDRDGRVVVFSLSDGKSVYDLSGHGFGISDIVFSPDGQKLSSVGWGQPGSRGATMNSLVLWNLQTRKPIARLKGFQKYVSELAFTGDGSFVAAGTIEGKTIMWKADKGLFFKSLAGHKGEVTAVASSADGKLLATGGIDRTVRLWKLPEGEEVGVLEEHRDAIVDVAFSPDGKVLATASNDGRLLLWNVSNSEIQRGLEGYWGPIEAAGLSSDGQMLAIIGRQSYRDRLATFERQAIRVLDTRDGSLIQTLEVENQPRIAGVSFSADSKILGIFSREAVQLWKVSDWSPLVSFQQKNIRDMELSPDGETLAISLEYNVRTMRISDGKILEQMDGSKSRYTPGGIAFSKDGSMLAGFIGCRIYIWNPQDGNAYVNLPGLGELDFLFPPNSMNFLAYRALRGTGSFGWDPKDCAKNGDALRYVNSTDGRVWWSKGMDNGLAAFSKNGIILVTTEGSYPTKVQLREAGSGNVSRYFEVNAWIVGLALSPDGKFLVTASNDGIVQFWGILHR